MNNNNDNKKHNMMAVSSNGFHRQPPLKKKCSDDLKSFNTSVIKYRTELTNGVGSIKQSPNCKEIGGINSSYFVPKIPLHNKSSCLPEKIPSFDSREKSPNCGSPLKPVANNVQFTGHNTLVSNKFSHSLPCVFLPSSPMYGNITSSNNNNNGHFKSRYYGNHKNSERRKTGGSNASSGGQDITRRIYGLMERFSVRSNMFAIPPDPPGLINGNEFDSLNRSIWEVYTWNAQTRETYLNKLEFWKHIYLSLQKVIVRYGLYLVGSTMSGLGLDNSDIDMCLLVRPSMADPRSDALGQLQIICELLESCEFVKSPEVIMAKVPILKFRDAQSRFEVDLNCNNAVGIRNTHLLNAYASLDWRVRPLVLLVKMWAQANDINDAKRMTINSYSLTLMMIHFLQCGVNPPVIPCLQVLYPQRFSNHIEIQSLDLQEELPPFHSGNTQSLGELFLGFLHYYGTFNYNQFAISVRQGALLNKEDCRYARSPKNDATQWKLLCVEEPFELTNTARCVYDLNTFEHIKSVFRLSYETLMQTKNLNSILTPVAVLQNGNNSY